jgi:hypothetical protein
VPLLQILYNVAFNRNVRTRPTKRVVDVVLAFVPFRQQFLENWQDLPVQQLALGRSVVHGLVPLGGARRGLERGHIGRRLEVPQLVALLVAYVRHVLFGHRGLVALLRVSVPLRDRPVHVRVLLLLRDADSAGLLVRLGTPVLAAGVPQLALGHDVRTALRLLLGGGAIARHANAPMANLVVFGDLRFHAGAPPLGDVFQVEDTRRPPFVRRRLAALLRLGLLHRRVLGRRWRRYVAVLRRLERLGGRLCIRLEFFVFGGVPHGALLLPASNTPESGAVYRYAFTHF